MALHKRSNKGFPVRLSCVAAVFLAAVPMTASAQEWRFEPIVRVGGEYDDNATLNIRTDEEVSLSGLLLELRGDIKYTSDKTTLLLQPRYLRREYDVSELSSDDAFARAAWSYSGRSFRFGLRGNFDRQTIRTAERAVSDLEIEDPDEITDDDSGRVLLSGTRSKWRLTPSLDYQINATSSVGADLDYFDVEYEDVLQGTLNDYTDTRLKLNYRRAFSDVNTALLTATGRTFNSSVADRDITGYGLQAGFERRLSAQTRVVAMIGIEDSDQEGVDIDPEAVGSVTLVRNLETIRMFARYQRSLAASGVGRLSARDSISLNFLRRLNERITAGLGVRAYQSRGVAQSASTDDRDYVQLQSNFSWYVTQAFVIEANYRYTVSDRSAAVGERSNSNQVNLWFVYQPRTVPRL